jgi:hypothetical protein
MVDCTSFGVIIAAQFLRVKKTQTFNLVVCQPKDALVRTGEREKGTGFGI